MRLLLGCILVAGQFSVSCSNGHENTSKLDSVYVGDENLQVTFHESRVYVVSSRKDLSQLQLSNGGFLTSLRRTTQTGSTNHAWVSDSIVPSAEQMIVINATSGNQKLVYGFTFLNKNDSWQLKNNSVESEWLPARQLVPGNQVDIDAFMAAFNQYRSQYGLPSVRYSHRLSVDAGKNNSLQQRYGLGHHFMGNSSAQNSAVGYGSVQAALYGWHHSSGHRINMQGRQWRCMGIHWQGRYWTQNFSAWNDCQ